MLKNVRHLDGGIEGQIRVTKVRLTQQVGRVSGGIEKIGVAKGDVLHSGIDQLIDVGDNRLGADDTHPPVVKHRYRTMPTPVTAPVRCLDGTHQTSLALPLETGVLR